MPAAALLIAAAFWLGMRWSKVPARVSQFEVNPPSSTYFNFRNLSGVPVMASYGPGSMAPFTVTTNWLDLVKK